MSPDFLTASMLMKVPMKRKSFNFQYEKTRNRLIDVKGELQRQNKLISSERPFKILQNETKIIKIGHAVLEIFNFKD